MPRIPEEAVRAFRMRRGFLGAQAPDTATAVAALPPLPASPSAYVALHARVPGFRAAALDRMVFEEGSLRLFPLPSAGLSLVPVEVLPSLLALHAFSWGSRARRSKTWRRTVAEFEALAPDFLGALADGPRPLFEMPLGAPVSGAPAALRRKRLALASFLAGRGRVRLGFSPQSLFGDLTCALPAQGEAVPAASTLTFAFLEDIARYYFAVAGPATRDDFLRWTSLSRSAARHSIEDLAGLIDEVDLEGGHAATFMIEEDAAELRALRPRPAGRAALLPSDDPAGLATREGIAALCEPRLRPRLIAQRGAGPLRPALAGGSVVGLWRTGPRGGPVEVVPARTLRDEESAALEAAAEGLTAFLEGDLARLARGRSPAARRPFAY